MEKLYSQAEEFNIILRQIKIERIGQSASNYKDYSLERVY